MHARAGLWPAACAHDACVCTRVFVRPQVLFPCDMGIRHQQDALRGFKEKGLGSTAGFPTLHPTASSLHAGAGPLFPAGCWRQGGPPVGQLSVTGRGWSPHLADLPPAKPPHHGTPCASHTSHQGAEASKRGLPLEAPRRGVSGTQTSVATCLQGAECIGQTGASWVPGLGSLAQAFWKPLTAGPGVSSGPEGASSGAFGSKVPPLLAWLAGHHIQQGASVGARLAVPRARSGQWAKLSDVLSSCATRG